MKIWSGYESMEGIILGVCAFNAQGTGSISGQETDPCEPHSLEKNLPRAACWLSINTCVENMQIHTLGRGFPWLDYLNIILARNIPV